MVDKGDGNRDVVVPQVVGQIGGPDPHAVGVEGQAVNDVLLGQLEVVEHGAGRDGIECSRFEVGEDVGLVVAKLHLARIVNGRRARLVAIHFTEEARTVQRHAHRAESQETCLSSARWQHMLRNY